MERFVLDTNTVSQILRRNATVLGRLRVFDRITFDKKIMGGRACIRGMRIPVPVIVSQVAHGAPVADILQGYPDLEPQDIQ